MNLPMPKGFQPPNTARPGEPFEIVATVRMTEDGLRLEALDGMKIEEAPEPEMDDRTDGSRVRLPFGEEETEMD